VHLDEETLIGNLTWSVKPKEPFRLSTIIVLRCLSSSARDGVILSPFTIP
jgi:hypothetical protein